MSKYASLILVAIALGCSQASDPFPLQAATRNVLGQIALVGAACHAKHDISSFTSLPELLKVAQIDHHIESGDIQHLSQDAWNRPLNWKVTKTDSGSIVSVWSNGKNGVDDSEQGDDIFLHFVIAQNGSISTTSN